MDVDKVFHMKEGLGDTSYFQNSSIQVSFVKRALHLKAYVEVYRLIFISPTYPSLADVFC